MNTALEELFNERVYTIDYIDLQLYKEGLLTINESSKKTWGLWSMEYRIPPDRLRAILSGLNPLNELKKRLTKSINAHLTTLMVESLDLAKFDCSFRLDSNDVILSCSVTLA